MVCFILLNFLVILLCEVQVLCLPAVIRIGGLFTEDQRDSAIELAFKFAVQNVNENKLLLPNTTLIYDIQHVQRHDSFHSSKKVCKQISYGVQAIFGPFDASLGLHIQSITDALDIPHLEARAEIEPREKEFSINLHPTTEDINKAFKDTVDFLKWKKFAIVYEDDYGLMKVQDVIRSPVKNMELYIRQGNPESYRQILREVKHKEIFNIIVDTYPENMSIFLRSLLQLQMNDYRYHYIFTSFDVEAFDLEDFKYNFVNITAFRLIDNESPVVQRILEEMQTFHSLQHSLLYKDSVLKMNAAIMYDAVNVFSQGLHSLERSATIALANLSCQSEIPWADGSSLFNYIAAVEYSGLTGPIKFLEGKRNNLKLDILRLRNEQLLKVGEWTSEVGINITDHHAFFASKKPNVTLRVITIEEKPYVMLRTKKNFTLDDEIIGFCIDLLDKVSAMAGFSYRIEMKKNIPYGTYDELSGSWNGLVKLIMDEEMPYIMARQSTNRSGNGRYEGFCVDLMEAISEIVSFDYEIVVSEDDIYGIYDMETKEWNGLVKELMSKKADLAVGSMTINYARESVIDFTKPFMNLGISILFKLPTSQPTRLFSFMNPLAIEIWLYVLAAYILVSFTMFVMARFSPFEWNNPHPCVEEADVIENQFSLNNSFWFITGTLLRQGSGLNPKATSTRIVGGIWWFFTLIIISSYTANLAAFLTVERTITPIENAEDLANQDEIEYGTLEGGSTMAFFRDSKIETYRNMWRYMESQQSSVFVPTIEEGVQRVLKGNYAFLMESTMLDYTMQRNCNLTQIGGLLNSNSYGIATPIGSPWRDKISLAILELQEKGVIQMLYSKWWKNTGDVCNRDEKNKDSKANALGVENIGGVFVVLLCGLALAIVVAILEFCWNSRKNAQSDKQSLCSEMAEELQFAIRCRGTKTKPAFNKACHRCSLTATHVPAFSETSYPNGINSVKSNSIALKDSLGLPSPKM